MVLYSCRMIKDAATLFLCDTEISFQPLRKKDLSDRRLLLSLKLTCTGCQYFEVFVIWNKKLKSAAAKLFTLEESKYRIINSLIRMTLSWSLSEIQAWSNYNFVTNEWSYYMQICHIYMQISKICPLFSEVFVIFLLIFFPLFFFHSHGSLCFYWISNYCWFLPCIKKNLDYDDNNVILLFKIFP